MSLETTDNIDLVKKPRLDNYFIWLLLAFLIGLTLRLLALNAMVYTQNELVLVNLALQISRRVGVVTSTVPIYTGLTSWLFYLFGPGNFLARLVPAFVGASIVIIPWLWKDQLGRKSSLILSFALALDPTFLLFSRAIHGGIFALVGLAWAITLLKQNKPWLAGISLALAFLSGSAFWSFLFILGLTLLVLMLIKPEIVKDLLVLNLNSLKITWISFAAGFAVSAFLIMSGFLLDPSGLGGVASGLIAFVRNFVKTFEYPAHHMIYLLIAHSTLPLFVFFIGFFKFRSSETSDWYQLAGISIIISLLIGMLVSRESFEILLLPVLICWIGGASWLGKWQFRLTESRLSTALLMGFVLAILTYLSVNLRRLAQLTLGTPQFWNIFLMIMAGIILLVSAWWLAKFGWSNGTGTHVFLFAFLCFLAIASLSSSTRSLQSDQQVRSLEYLDNQLVLPNNDVEEILADFALTGKTLEQWGSFSLIDLPEELSWYFRDFNIARNQPGTSLVLSRTTSMPIQNDQFRGMNVVLERSINWRKGGITAYLQTASGKTSVFEDNKGVLWVRTFLFTGASQ
jgi:hypothetical protein